jgi:hypothetical protein
MDMADRLAADGYKDVGYQFINIDDCWASKERDDHGRLQADPVRFPNGIAALAQYVHGKGLKLGIYGDYGTHTCGGYPGSIDYLQTDINTFASWGIDMLKLDGCYANITGMPQAYQNVADLLNATGRHIVFSCSWPAYWVVNKQEIDYSLAAKSCNLWRNYHDIADSWDSVKDIVDHYTTNQDTLIPAAGPGHWNDPDMILAGDFGLSYDEQKAQFAIWSIWSAPLLMSNDLRNIPEESKEILQNKEVIAVNQDPLGKQGRMIYNKEYDIPGASSPGSDKIFAKELHDGSYAVVFFNSGSFSSPHNINVTFEEVGITSKSVLVRDLFQKKDLGIFTNKFTAYVNPSGVVMVKMTPFHF